MAQQNMLVEAGVMLPQIANPVPLSSAVIGKLPTRIRHREVSRMRVIYGISSRSRA